MQGGGGRTSWGGMSVRRWHIIGGLACQFGVACQWGDGLWLWLWSLLGWWPAGGWHLWGEPKVSLLVKPLELQHYFAPFSKAAELWCMVGDSLREAQLWQDFLHFSFHWLSSLGLFISLSSSPADTAWIWQVLCCVCSRRPRLKAAGRPASFHGTASLRDGDGSLPRPRTLRPPRQPSITDEDVEPVALDGSTYRHMVQDLTTCKTNLLRLKRLIQEVREMGDEGTKFLLIGWSFVPMLSDKKELIKRHLWCNQTRSTSGFLWMSFVEVLVAHAKSVTWYDLARHCKEDRPTTHDHAVQYEKMLMLFSVSRWCWFQ